jgi:hypothetical protein
MRNNPLSDLSFRAARAFARHSGPQAAPLVILARSARISVFQLLSPSSLLLHTHLMRQPDIRCNE